MRSSRYSPGLPFSSASSVPTIARNGRGASGPATRHPPRVSPRASLRFSGKHRSGSARSPLCAPAPSFVETSPRALHRVWCSRFSSPPSKCRGQRRYGSTPSVRRSPGLRAQTRGGSPRESRSQDRRTRVSLSSTKKRDRGGRTRASPSSRLLPASLAWSDREEVGPVTPVGGHRVSRRGRDAFHLSRNLGVPLVPAPLEVVSERVPAGATCPGQAGGTSIELKLTRRYHSRSDLAATPNGHELVRAGWFLNEDRSRSSLRCPSCTRRGACSMCKARGRSDRPPPLPLPSNPVYSPWNSPEELTKTCDVPRA